MAQIRQKIVQGDNIMWVETYSEYHADCDKCGKQILEVNEYMDSKRFDEESGVCPKCHAIFCGKCVLYATKAEYICPYCFGELLVFDYVYDFIEVVQHNYQPFETKSEKPESVKVTIEKLENILEELNPDVGTKDKIRKQIRELKVQDMFAHGQKQIISFGGKER
jgi:hypothetical protein